MMRFAFVNLAKKEPCWLLMNLGHGFIESALTVIERLADTPPEKIGGVCSFLAPLCNLHQGLEDFLKGASLRVEREPQATHDLRKLSSAYNKHIQHRGYGADLCFSEACVDRVARWDDWAASKVGPGEVLRYLMDRRFVRVFDGMRISEDELWETAVVCRDECIRVHIVLVQTFVGASPSTIVHPLQAWWEPDKSFERRVEEVAAKRRLSVGRKREPPGRSSRCTREALDRQDSKDAKKRDKGKQG